MDTWLEPKRTQEYDDDDEAEADADDAARRTSKRWKKITDPIFPFLLSRNNTPTFADVVMNTS